MSTISQKAVPAQLNFFAIYNPSLSNTDETLDDQIVYYSCPETRKRYRQHRRSGKSPPKSSQEEKNERLRQIGLAQGMVEFARTFSEERAVDTIETEQSRIILHELEAGWWLLASISLTKLPATARDTSTKSNSSEEPPIEYSSREVKPPALLLQDLLRAHSNFLLHHASSMSALFIRTRRSGFVNILGRYWDIFLSSWNVMLHGNPVVNVYGGIKLAASGELGMGVGEEDRGSGEREVLEGFIERIDGLVDLVVSKFGNAEPDAEAERGLKRGLFTAPNKQWLGTGAEPTPEDGTIFLGVGALSRKSLRDVTHWMEDIYSWGSQAYGVADNPTSTRKSRRRSKMKVPENTSSNTKGSENPSPELVKPRGSEVVPKNLVGHRPPVSPIASDDTLNYKETKGQETRPPLQRGLSNQSSDQTVSTGGMIASYFKLGYGTHWTLGPKPSHEQLGKAAEREAQLPVPVTNSPRSKSTESRTKADSTRPASIYPQSDSVGHFLIGLMGNIEDDWFHKTDHNNTTIDKMTVDEGEVGDGNFTVLVRTVTVESEGKGGAHAEAGSSIDLSMVENDMRSSRHGGPERTGTSHTSFESQDRSKTKELQVVVYVHRPFIFTFLFELGTDALALLGLYRSIHHQLKPLLRPLLSSTNHRLVRPEVTTSTAETKKIQTPIYDLIWDPNICTITSTIPNIPEPHKQGQVASQAPWSRIEALNTHMQLLSNFAETRNDRFQLERTCKTSRGWWVVWTRIPDLDINSSIRAIPSVAPSPRLGPDIPLLTPEDSIGAQKLSTEMVEPAPNRSMYSGSAQPFLELANVVPEVVPKGKEILLIRRASDYAERTPSRFAGTNSLTGETGWGSGTAKLAQGIGVDTRRYIEGLLSMSR